jgi:hypothetical protein
VAGRDAAERSLITLAVDDCLLERLLTFDAGAETTTTTVTASLRMTRR